MASLFGMEKQEVIRIKVKKCEGLMQPEYKKLCVDPQLTSYEIMRNLLGRAFNIKGDYSISYLTRDDWGHEMYLSLLSDWDLDAAFLSASDPYLRLKVDTKPFEEGLEDWDIVAPQEPRSTSLAQLAAMDRGLLGQMTRNLTSQVGKTVSQMSKAMGLKSEEEGVCLLSKPPMSDAEFHNYLDTVGHLTKPQEFRMRVYQGGIEHSLRSVLWRHLLNIFPEGLSGKERFEYTKKKNKEYYKLRDEWREVFSQGKGTEEIKFITNMVKKDVLRTDRTHAFYAGSDENQNTLSLFNILVTYALTHPEVAYCQGMSDLASPLLAVQKDEAIAYLCFCGLMKRLHTNFLLDDKVMTTKFAHLTLLLQHRDLEFYNYLKSQEAADMFFCYRWLLLELKREFPFDDALLMLEVMWSSLPPDPPETELELADPSYKENKLHSSPSPSLATQAYMRLRARQRHIAMPANTAANNKDSLQSLEALMQGKNHCAKKELTPVVPITPMEEEKELDPKDFICVADETTKELMNTSSDIDKALGSDPIQCIEPLKDLQKFLNRTGSGRGRLSSSGDSSRESSNTCSPKHTRIDDVHTSHNNKQSIEPLAPAVLCTAIHEVHDKPSTSSQPQCSPTPSGHSLTIDCPSAIVDKDPDAPESPRRPTNIPLKNTCIQEQPKSVLIHGKGGILTERSLELTSDLNSCEEATESPLIDFSRAPIKLPPLPPPQEFGSGNPFLLFLCLTLLVQQRDHIMRNRLDYNDLAMHFDHMVRRHNVSRVLNQAQALYAVYLRAQANNSSSDSGSSDDCT